MATDPVAGEADDDPYLGRKVGNYLVERKLGQGGMGAVYLLKHRELPGTYQALKVLGDGGDTVAAKTRFDQEAYVAAAIGSHRVVKPLDIGRFGDGGRYIIMEYVAGRALADELDATGPLSSERALVITARIADTMVIAHQKGIVHRDLKPQNVMLADEGEDVVKILDFGVARASGDLKVVQTSERAVIGTPGYMSPEAATALTVDGRSDVFSLAVMLFQMLTGELPFPAPTVEAAVMNLIGMPAPTVKARRPTHLAPVRDDVEAVVAMGLTKEPSKRPSMSEFLRQLVAALEGLGVDAGVRVQRLSQQQMPTLAKTDGRIQAMVDRLSPALTPQPMTAPAGGEALLGTAETRPSSPAKKPGAMLWVGVAIAGLAVAAGAFALVRHQRLAPVAPPPVVVKHDPPPAPSPAPPTPAAAPVVPVAAVVAEAAEKKAPPKKKTPPAHHSSSETSATPAPDPYNAMP